MSIADIVGEVKRKLAVAKTARTKEDKARDRVSKVVGKIQLEEARERLRAARLERLTREAEAKAALETAKAKIDRAKALQLQASQEKWRARYSRARAVVSPFGPIVRGTVKGAKATARGVARLQREYYGEDEPRRKPAPIRKKKAVVKKKAVAKKR